MISRIFSILQVKNDPEEVEKQSDSKKEKKKDKKKKKQKKEKADREKENVLKQIDPNLNKVMI